MEHTESEIVALAQKYLEPHQPADYRITVLPEGVRHQNGWWYVVAVPSREDVRSYDFGARLSEAAIDFENGESIPILYTTVMPHHVG